jgi:pimeloyl-ACP methyl ester carboxylesterase
MGYGPFSHELNVAKGIQIQHNTSINVPKHTNSMTLNKNNIAPYDEEQIAELGDVKLAFDSFGDKSHPPMLLIMGLGMQLINWDDLFCSQLASLGFWVIRFDNRDAGNSTKFTKRIGLLNLLWATASPRSSTPQYTLEDMAKDTVKLLDKLNIDKAHIVGASMGGMIAQIIAINHPEKLLSLTSIMSTTGNRKLPRPKAKMTKAMLKPIPKTREQYLKNATQLWKLLNGGVMPFDEDRVLLTVSKGYDRRFYPAGISRQLHTIICADDRTQALNKVIAPTLIIHGDIDPLVPIEAGYATAQAISHSKMDVIKGMGHNLPPQTWAHIISEIKALTEEAKTNLHR